MSMPYTAQSWEARVAAHRSWSCVAAAVIPVLLRLLLLPVAPPPEPYYHDEFAYLLGADTFAQGRLTNPPHPMWVHLEAFHVNPIPTYASKYPPAQAILLAVGQAVFGHPWVGVLIGYAFMCGAVCWALQGWGPPWAALLVSVLSGLHLGFGWTVHSISSHWLNCYWGGAVACAGAALVIGALPRLARRASSTTMLAAATGLLVLLNSRPFEGTVMTIVCGAVLAVFCRGKWQRIGNLGRVAVAIPAIALLLCGGAFMAYYNYRVTGSPLDLPYLVNQRMYGSVPAFWLAGELPKVAYRHEEIRRLYVDWDLVIHRTVRAAPWISFELAARTLIPFLFSVFWLPVLPALLLMRPCRKFKIAVGALAAFVVLAILPMKMVLTHYFAPAIPLVLIVVMQGFRLLKVALRRRNHRARLVYGAWVSLCLLMAFLSAVAWGMWSHQTSSFTQARSTVKALLAAAGPRHLVIVRRGKNASMHEDWIVNEADIDGSKIVWARDMSPAQNRELLAYFGDRKKWLLEPDQTPLRLVQYPE